jgi:hypothetical protein
MSRTTSKLRDMLRALSAAGPNGVHAPQARRLTCWCQRRASELREAGLIETRYVLTEAGRQELRRYEK